MVCSKCGSPLPDNVKFCENCGAPAQRQSNAAEQKSEPVLQYVPTLTLEGAQPADTEQRFTPTSPNAQSPIAPPPIAPPPIAPPPIMTPQPQDPTSSPDGQAKLYQQTSRLAGSPSSLVRRVGIPALVMLLLTLIFTFVIFVLIDSQPGDPALIALGLTATESEQQRFRLENDIDKPVIVRYARALTGNFGVSRNSRQPVSEMIKERAPTTAYLILSGMIVTLIISIPLGIMSAIRRNRLIDALTSAISMLFRAIPFFMIALAFVRWFSVDLGILPVSGAGTWKHYILPGVALGLPCLGFAAQTIRATAIKVMRSGAGGLVFPDSGLSNGRALQNAALPTISESGLQLGWLFGGAILIETLFAMPGVGQSLLMGIMYRDYPVVIGSVMSLSVFFLAVSLVFVFVVAGAVFLLTPKNAKGLI